MPPPRSLEVEGRELVIEWPDGSQARYPLDGLRAVCPCVICAGGHAGMGKEVDPRALHEAPERGVTIEAMDYLGNYAIQFHWSDGHSTGIYTWQFLRQLVAG